MNKDEKKLWLDLYKIAEDIEALEPWKYLWDTYVTMYISEKYQDIFYCSVMGKAGVHTAVAIYQADEIHKYVELSKSQLPEHTLINYQECLTCNFLTKDQTLKDNIKLINKLGINFKKSYISFESFQKGYEPCAINLEQVEILIDTLGNFYSLLKDIVEQKLVVDFENKESALRYYDKTTKQMVNANHVFLLPLRSFKTLKLSKQDEERLAKAKTSKQILEFDFLNYLPIRINQLQEDKLLAYPRARFMADETSELILESNLINMQDYKNEDEYLNETLNLLIKYIEENGKPKKIYVRDEEAKHLLDELQRVSNIQISVCPRLKILDYMFKMFLTTTKEV